MLLGIFLVFLFWNKFVRRFKKKLVKEKTLITVKKYGWIALIVFPSLPLTLSLSHIPATVIFKSLYDGKKRFFSILILGQIIRIFLSTLIAVGFIKLLPFYLF